MEEQKILKYIMGELDVEGLSEVESWSKESSENRKMIERLYYVKFLGERVAAYNAVDLGESFAKFRKLVEESASQDAADEENESMMPKRGWFKRAKNILIPIAAALAGIAVTCGAFLMTFDAPANYTMQTAEGQRANCTLPDGTKVWLNSSSKVVYSTSLFSKERRVALLGEGYFEVVKDKHAPFIVSSKGVDIEVLGTRFNVRAKANEERVTTTLMEGSVKAGIEKTGENIILKPGDVLAINTETHHHTLHQMASAEDVLMWRSGKLKFMNKPFEEIAEGLETQFNVHFVFKDKKLLDECFTCEFKTDSDIRDILDVLALTRHINYRCEGETVYIMANK